MNNFSRGWLLFVLAVVAVAVLVTLGRQSRAGAEKEMLFSEFEEAVRKNKIKSARISDVEISGEFKDGGDYATYRVEAPGAENKDKVMELLRGTGVEYSFRHPSRFWENFLPYLILLPLAGLFLYIIFKYRIESGAGGAISFGKARARLVTKDTVNVTFEDVAGVDEAKEEVAEIVEFLKNPDKFRKIGARVPRGVLLVGPPGAGKTLLAKAIAGEAGVPFFSISGSDFVEMFVGVGASRVRDLFQQAKQRSPAIVFLDEIDAVGRRRGAGLGGGHDEREQTLNAILVEMDGFDTSDRVIVIAATNRPDVLDPALLRPGRFDRRVVVDLPDMKGREAILKVHARKIRMDKSVVLAEVARMTVAFSGADLENLLNEAALLAVVRGHEVVMPEDIEEAREKVVWGKERRSRRMEEEDRRITAFHEAGHAVVAWFTPSVDKPHKITIMPRGMSFLGATMKMPERDKYIFTKKQIEGEIDVLYGGRVAEEAFCSDISVGAAEDIRRATDLIRKMVTRWGMSDRLGPLTYTDEEENVFLGYEITRQRVNSEKTNEQVDEEVRRISEEAMARAKSIVRGHADALKTLASTLLSKEVLNKDDIEVILGKPVNSNGRDGGGLPPAEQEDGKKEKAD